MQKTQNKGGTARNRNTVCYLCGKRIHKNLTKDHVPPKVFFPTQMRSNLNLRHLPTHPACNEMFSKDEQYFVVTLIPFVMLASTAGRALWEDVKRSTDYPEGLRLLGAVLREVNPTGLVLPNGKMIKHFNGRRVGGIIWKLVRGLHFVETGTILSESRPRVVKLSCPGERPPDEFFLIVGEPTKGRYPGVFDYRYKYFTNHHGLQTWAMLLWNSLIATVSFRSPR